MALAIDLAPDAEELVEIRIQAVPQRSHDLDLKSGINNDIHDPSGLNHSSKARPTSGSILRL